MAFVGYKNAFCASGLEERKQRDVGVTVSSPLHGLTPWKTRNVEVQIPRSGRSQRQKARVLVSLVLPQDLDSTF